MNTLLTVLIAGIIGLIVVTGTLTGLGTAAKSQAMLRHKGDFVLASQGINNVLQNTTSCALSIDKQTIYYANGQVAYQAGNESGISSFTWTKQNTITVLTMQSIYSMIKPVTLNLDCNTVTITDDHNCAVTGQINSNGKCIH